LSKKDLFPLHLLIIYTCIALGLFGGFFPLVGRLSSVSLKAIANDKSRFFLLSGGKPRKVPSYSPHSKS